MKFAKKKWNTFALGFLGMCLETGEERCRRKLLNVLRYERQHWTNMHRAMAGSGRVNDSLLCAG